ncbi:MAG: hypothetical protein P4M01_11130 [Acidobacteriota bacterium]|nr:hypothetical protein [Acidobacteriota bacterium]
MLANVFDFLFGCTHQNYSFPMTTRTHGAHGHAGRSTYVVCLDCGKEFAYDWEHMKIVTGAPAQTHPEAAPVAASLAAPTPDWNKAA